MRHLVWIGMISMLVLVTARAEAGKEALAGEPPEVASERAAGAHAGQGLDIERLVALLQRVAHEAAHTVQQRLAAHEAAHVIQQRQEEVATLAAWEKLAVDRGASVLAKATGAAERLRLAREDEIRSEDLDLLESSLAELDAIAAERVARAESLEKGFTRELAHWLGRADTAALRLIVADLLRLEREIADAHASAVMVKSKHDAMMATIQNTR